MNFADLSMGGAQEAPAQQGFLHVDWEILQVIRSSDTRRFQLLPLPGSAVEAIACAKFGAQRLRVEARQVCSDEPGPDSEADAFPMAYFQ